MREFAVVVINFLREYYGDAYRYSCTLNQGVPWRECLTLDVRDDYLTIHISESQMFHLYELYKDNDNVWQDQLQELIEM
jgi:hypothetical protein